MTIKMTDDDMSFDEMCDVARYITDTIDGPTELTYSLLTLSGEEFTEKVSVPISWKYHEGKVLVTTLADATFELRELNKATTFCTVRCTAGRGATPYFYADQKTRLDFMPGDNFTIPAGGNITLELV